MNLCFFLVLAIAVSETGTTRAAGYTFTNVGDTSGALAWLCKTPAVNESGAVAFVAGLDVGGSSLFIWKAGVLRELANTRSGLFNAFGPAVALNDENTVAFRATLRTGGHGIFTAKGGSTRAIVLNDQMGGTLSQGLDVNAEGEVSFFANFPGNGGGVYSTREGAFIEIARKPRAPFAATGLSVNASGAVAFRGYHGGYSAIVVGDGTSKKLVALHTLQIFFSNFGDPVINDAGTVAFGAAFLPGAGSPRFSAIFRADLEGITPVITDDVDTPFRAVFDRIAINSTGTIAFLAVLRDRLFGGLGIFTGPDPVADKVIYLQDPLFGSTIVRVGMGMHALNDSGQIAFYYKLADRRRGIAIATPAP